MLIPDINCLLTKEELKDANCCRFCGLGADKSDLLTKNEDFVSIYANATSSDNLGLEDGRTLDVLINKYLPIKVSEKELYYPQVICSSCHTSLRVTVGFFEKIVQGQKILAKIINGLQENRKIVEHEKTEETSLAFSEENPVLAAPKRRGRPRRDPNNPKPKPPPVPSEYLELKPKRRSRPPARYEPGVSTGSSEVVVKQEIEEPPENANKENDEFLSHLGLQPTELASVKGDVSNLLNVSSEYTSLTNAPSIMDISKLSVIMDGDEETDQQGLLQVNPSETVQEKREGTPSIDVVGHATERTISSGVSVGDEGVLVVGELSKGDDNDSDASVKTIDFVVVKKKKRGRKKIKKHKLQKVVSCEICNKEFSHLSSLKYHRASAHAGEKKYVCHICGKGFTHKQLLTNHVYVHSDEKIFKCSSCPARFKSRASLYTHNKSIHTSHNHYVCPQCGSKFNLKSSLKAHIRLHTGEKPFACEFCSKRFAQRSNYSEHRRIHTGERPYKCDFANCGKAFTTASQLRSHKMTHSGLKQFLCSVCGRGFTHSENFKYHMRRHTGDKAFECQTCMKPFPDAAALSKHLKEKHGGDKVTCEVCSQVLPDVASFEKHKETHNQDTTNAMEVVAPEGVVDPCGRLTSEVEVETEPASAEVPTTVVGAQEQVIEAVSDYQGDAGSFVQILNSDSVPTLDESGQEVQQVIYLCPDELSYYTITLADNQESLEVRQSEESLQGLGGSITFAAVDAEIAAQYFNLENVSGATISVPATTSGATEMPGSSSSSEISTYFIESKTDEARVVPSEAQQ